MKTDILEDAIRTFEKSLEVCVTIVDYQGTFHKEPNGLIFSLDRQSHRKNPACKAGFCEQCVDHCRHEVNARFLQSDEPFVDTCWKGVSELAVPMQNNGRHLGIFYVGSWRQKENSTPNNLPSRFYRQYKLLKELKEDHIAMLPMITIFVKGLVKQLEDLQQASYPIDSVASKIKSFITNNAEKSIQLEDLTQYLNLSRSRVSSLLKQHFNNSFPTLLNEERIKRAETLLKVTDLKVKKIAKEVGFADEYHFNKVFRQINGMPPGKFRRQTGKH